jgi:hypothetical protein
MPDAINSGAAAENPMVVVAKPEAEEYDYPDGPAQLPHPDLRDTGNEANISYEEAALRELYGEPDADGVYGKGASDA